MSILCPCFCHFFCNPIISFFPKTFCTCANCGDKFSSDECYYYSFLLLLQICSIVMCPSITLHTIPYRVSLLKKKFLFKELYPTTTIIQNMQYMLHYPSQIYMFGPLINIWTMRQEAKCSFIKRSSQRENFKNPPKSVVNNTHQLWLAYKLGVECKHFTGIQFDSGKCTYSYLTLLYRCLY